MNCKKLLLFIIILNFSFLQAQFLENIAQNNIRSVQFSPQEFELGYPILSSKNDTSLQLSFDLMGDSQPALAYRLIHCNADWKQSAIHNSDFLYNSFNEFYIDDYTLSTATQKLYTHYQTIIAKKQLKISGNYIVQVFPEDKPETTWMQMRFVYAQSEVNIEGSVLRETDNQYHKTHQRVKFEVQYDKSKFIHPRTNITAVISQNFRWDNVQLLKPLFIDNKLLRFTYIDKKGLFSGNYEFPYFDTSEIRQKTHTIRTLEQDENNEVHCYLYPNETATNNYFYLKDMNGNFAIKAENTFQPKTESDYVWVHFTFISAKLPTDVFVIGRFNQWKAEETEQLAYDDELGFYHVGLLLKQGVYNYTFVTRSASGQLQNLLGNYGETENDYYIFTYYRDERLQTDLLVGWKRLNSNED